MFSFHHVAISVTSLDKSVEFYSTFGFHKVLEWSTDDGSLGITHLKLRESLLELFCYSSTKEAPVSTQALDTDLPVVGVKHFGLKVASLTEAKDLLAKKGYVADVQIKRGRTGIDYFFIKDPDGIFVEIVQDDRNLE